MNMWLVVFLIFIFSFALRLWGLNEMGRTWDEQEYIEQGHKMVELLSKGDFNNSYFYTTYDHPPLLKYLYGLTAHLDVEKILPGGNVVFHYDYTYSRILSAFISSLAVVLVVFIGWRIFSSFVGIVGGIIIATLPIFLGFSQLVATESFVMLIFTACVYSYILLIKEFSWKKVMILGLLTGIALQVKQSNVLLFPIYFFTYLVWYFRVPKKERVRFYDIEFKVLVVIFVISIIVFILMWPTLIFHFKEVYVIHSELWHVQFSPKIWQITLSPPEVFFGRLMLTPIFYYPIYFVITTPFLILAAFLLGLKIIQLRKNWVLYSLVIWFVVPFAMSIYSWRQHGLRYIIEIYAPLSIIAAIGFEYMARIIGKKPIKQVFFVVFVIFYMLVILLKAKPYYLDYFNILVGGTEGVYKNKMFQLGWWGQGIREAGMFLKENASKDSRVGLAISPSHVFPEISGLKIENFQKNQKYDYVVVNYYNILREGFDEGYVKRNYTPVYFVKADGAILATVYKNI